MNKYQKALDYLTFPIKSILMSSRCGGKTLTQEQIDLLQELVDKATPIKPIVIYDDELGQYGEKIAIEEYCPICKEELHNVGGAYCHGCGQKIDWRIEYD